MVTMWSMARAPLIWGGSPSKSNESTLALLSDDAVLGVSTSTCRNRRLDIAGAPDSTAVWAAQSLDSHGRVVALFNLGDAEATVGVGWEQLALPRRPKCSELWSRDSLVSCGSDRVSARLQPHDAVLVRLE